MKMQRTQISNLPGSMAANSVPQRGYHSYKKPGRLIQATTPEIEARVSPSYPVRSAQGLA